MATVEWIWSIAWMLMVLAWIIVVLFGPGYPVRRLRDLEDRVAAIEHRLDEGCQWFQALEQALADHTGSPTDIHGPGRVRPFGDS